MQLGLGLGLGRYRGETNLAGATDPNFIMEVDTSLGDGLASMALPIQGTQPMTVDWGDGTVETVTQTDLPSSTNWVTHSYVIGGVYEIKVSKTLERFYFNNEGDAAKVIKVLNWGDCVWSSFVFSFRGCINNSSLPVLAIKNGENLTDFSASFRSNNLNEISPFLFNNCKNIVNLNVCFFSNNLNKIDSSLFFDLTNLSTLADSFRANGNIEIDPFIFKDNPNITSLLRCFQDSTLSINDLSRLYIELSLFQTQNNVPFHGGSGQYDPNFTTVIDGTTYTTGVERDALIARGWTLTDAGPII